MDVPRNATNLTLLLRLVDASGVVVTGIEFDDAGLSVESLKHGDTAWQEVVLQDGTLGTFSSNGWAEIGNGEYQYCPSNSLIVADRNTTFRVQVAANPYQYGTINAIGGASGLPVVIPAIEADSIVNGLDTEITRYRSTRWIVQALDIGSEPAKLYFSVKRGLESDADAVIQVVVSNPPDANDGMIVQGGAAAADKSLASIVVEEYDDGGETKIRAIATISGLATNVRPDTYRCDFKEVDSPSVLAECRIRVVDSVTDATS